MLKSHKTFLLDDQMNLLFTKICFPFNMGKLPFHKKKSLKNFKIKYMKIQLIGWTVGWPQSLKEIWSRVLDIMTFTQDTYSSSEGWGVWVFLSHFCHFFYLSILQSNPQKPKSPKPQNPHCYANPPQFHHHTTSSSSSTSFVTTTSWPLQKPLKPIKNPTTTTHPILLTLIYDPPNQKHLHKRKKPISITTPSPHKTHPFQLHSNMSPYGVVLFLLLMLFTTVMMINVSKT